MSVRDWPAAGGLQSKRLCYDLLQYFQPLHRQFRGQEGEPRRVAARARQTCDQAPFKGVGRLCVPKTSSVLIA
jgi:hypothetical protein